MLEKACKGVKENEHGFEYSMYRNWYHLGCVYLDQNNQKKALTFLDKAFESAGKYSVASAAEKVQSSYSSSKSLSSWVT